MKSPSPVRILGIDPGFDRLGICILDKNGNKESLVFSACITTNKKESFEKRLLSAGDELEKLIKKYSPDELSIEKIFFGKSKTTAINVAQIRGVCIYLAEKYKISVFEYSPPQIKLAIGGHGNASKKDIEFVVSKILSIPEQKLKVLDDEIDAMAIALAHSSNRKMLFWK